MSKPFLVVNVVEGELGVIYQFPTLEEAITQGVQLGTDQTDVPPDEIRTELETDADFLSPNGDIHIYLAQTEN